MCGIAGFISDNSIEDELRRMGDAISHRGPDETGYFCHGNVGIVSKRLSIIDMDNGRQPAYSEDGSVVVVLNGEIFNFTRLRIELKSKGHLIENNSDTAILPHMYEEYGTAMFEMLSGQFVIAVYDIVLNKLILARDRMGIIPLHYYHNNDDFFFGSEIKAIIANGKVRKRLSYQALVDVFTFWAPQSNRTIFKDIFSLPPGEFLEFRNGNVRKEVYYKLRFKEINRDIDFSKAEQQIESLLCGAVQKRLMGDVKISTYLSGGLDSSLITAILAKRYDRKEEVFSVCFEDKRFDESGYQRLLCEYFGIKQNTVLFRNSAIPGLLKDIVTHTETPILRAGPIPLYKLSRLVNESNVKVVLTGEGADEFFGGYDIYREIKIKSYLKKHPDSNINKCLFRKVNTFSDNLIQSASAASLYYFYTHYKDDVLESHYTRWRQISFFNRFFSDNVKGEVSKDLNRDFYEALNLNSVDEIKDWSPIQRSQYLEIKTFLSQYLLSSQCDRVSMANSVEARFPFLDDELIEYCMSLDDKFKIKALNEKYILKKIAEKYLPYELANRKKFPYRAPLDAKKIISDPYMEYILSDDVIKKYDVFNPLQVREFVKSVNAKDELSERETMLLLGILTTQLLFEIFEVEAIG